jgi:hypothetical protein
MPAKPKSTKETDANNLASRGCSNRLVVPWPDYTDYDGETAQLMRTVDQDWCWKFPGWKWVADQINAEYGNNRTAEACRKKWDVEIRKEAARCNPSGHNAKHIHPEPTMSDETNQ